MGFINEASNAQTCEIWHTSAMYGPLSRDCLSMLVELSESPGAEPSADLRQACRASIRMRST
jgi:hypothetical protein